MIRFIRIAYWSAEILMPKLEWQREVEYQNNLFLQFLLLFHNFFVALVGNVCSKKIYVPIRFLKDKS
jgi:hypothetical protein